MTEQLKCPGVGRDKDCISTLRFYFTRRVTDDEMRFLHDVIQRAVACMPQSKDERWAQLDREKKLEMLAAGGLADIARRDGKDFPAGGSR